MSYSSFNLVTSYPSILPTGTTAQRPSSTGGTDTVGMLRYNTTTNGGSGGSGVVIISTTSTASATTGSPTVTTSGGNNIYTFTSSGSITF